MELSGFFGSKLFDAPKRCSAMKWLLFLLLTIPASLIAQDDCAIAKQPFKAGEALTYEIVYNWGKVWKEAGSVTFSVDATEEQDQAVFHFIGEGGTYPKYDWFFKVRDKYQSWSGQDDIKPLKFIRQVSEGSLVLYYQYVFDQPANTANVKWFTSKKNRTGEDDITYPECSFDVLSAIYYCRSIDYSTYQINDTIPLALILDKQVEQTYLRYAGIQSYTTPNGNQVECIVFKPMLIEGTVFKGGEEMEVWVSNDANRVPLYIEAEILVGQIKVFLTDTKGLISPRAY